MRENLFGKSHFEHNQIQICIEYSPVSDQNKSSVKQEFKTEVHKVTEQCEYIITSTCWIAIDHYCRHIKRMKNPGAYDVDNIVKPILDSLVGLNGVLIDDVIADRVTVNWIDTLHDDYLEIDIQHPDLLYIKKSELVFLKSKSGWCFPAMQSLLQNDSFTELVKRYFETWESIKTEEEYFKCVGVLPIQNFIYFSKIKDKEYQFIELENC
jgi:Holliday junction resolvase RusA-like endonuclease